MRSTSVLSLIATAGAAAALGGAYYAGTRNAAEPAADPKPLVGAVNPKGKPIKLRTETPPKGRLTVGLQVVADPKARDTVALVPVFINGKGPLAFALDTGASSTVIDEKVARKVGLRPGKSLGTMRGVAGSTEGREVRIRDWRADKVKLVPDRVATIKGLAGKKGDGPQGLLGSDVLSRYGRVQIDYDGDKLILDPKTK